MNDQPRPNVTGPAETTGLGGLFDPHCVRRLERLVQRYAWCRVPCYWHYTGYADYLLVIQLPDGRRYWRCLASSELTPDEVMLRWASCPPAKWMKQFQPKTKGTNLWHEFFNFWIKT